MAYSSIIPKKCRCGCNKWPTTGFQGYNADCRPDLKEEKIKQQKERAKKKNAAIKDGRALRVLAVTDDGNREMAKGYAELERWFKERHKEMTGRCQNCMGKTEMDGRHYKCSIAHILPKAYFPSVATHPLNWLELCFYGKSCHTNMDNKMLDLTEMSCWDDIVTKFCAIYPSIAPKERRRIPEILLQYVEVEK